MQAPVPFNSPTIVGTESELLSAALSNRHISAGGPFTKEASELLRDGLDAKAVLLTTSCTAALEMAAMLARIEPGDAVVVPSFTFVTTALAFARQGAVLRFADIEPDTLGISQRTVAPLIDESVRAVVPVHYAGIPADPVGLRNVVDAQNDCLLIEDNAHGLFAELDGRPIGSIGELSTLSFHETKNFSCGEGGALVVNDESFVERAQVLLDKGTNRARFIQGHVDKYTWVDTGSSFGLSDALAALLVAQLRERDSVLSKRRSLETRYRSLLGDPLAKAGFTMPSTVPGASTAAHLVSVLAPSYSVRDALLNYLRGVGIHATFHYVPLHDSVGGLDRSDREYDCPVTTDVSQRLLRLPFFTDMTQAQVDRVAAELLLAIDKLL